MSFVNPLFLWGALAVSVPIIIHLLNRRRYKVVDWAAMEFLLEAYRERKRRVQLEHLLLLLLRCLAMLLLALVISRPFFKGGQLDALSTGGTERILLLDDSTSMRATFDGRTAFARSVDAASQLVERLAASRPADRVVIVRASRPDRSWFVADPVGEKAADARARLASLECSHRRVGASDAVRRFSDAFLAESDEATDRVVYYFSDFRRADWSSSSNAGDELSAAMQEQAVWVLLDAAAGPPDNLTILSVRTEPPIPVAGLPFDFVVRVANRGSQSLRAVPVDVELDGARLARRTIDELPAGGEAELAIAAPPQEGAGWRAVQVKLPADRLPADNTFDMALEVKQGVAVLIVDGDGSATPAEQDSFYLAKALAPRGAFRSGISPSILSPAQFQQLWDLAGYDLILLANYMPTNPRKIEALERYVAGGGAVGWLLGERVEPREANRLAYRDGKGLLPLELRAPEDLRAAGGGETDPVNFLPQTDAEPLSVFSGQTNPLRRQVNVYRAFAVEVPDTPPTGTEILARYTDADGHVAMAVKAMGAGKSFMLTTPVDLSWNDWPKDPSYLVFAHELVGFMTAHRGGAPTFRPGGTVELRLDPTRYAPKASYQAPGAKDAAELIAERREGDDGLWLAQPVGEAPGIARFDVTPILTGEGAAAPQTKIWRAVTVDPAESDLAKLPDEALRQQLPSSGYELLSLEGGVDRLMETLVGEKREIWLLLAILLVAVMLAESTLAFLFGRGR